MSDSPCTDIIESDDSGGEYCPELPKKLKHFQSDSTKNIDNNLIQDHKNDSDDDSYCPSLPPHMLKNGANLIKKVKGPTLPPPEYQGNLEESEDDNDIIGPLLPPSGEMNDGDIFVERELKYIEEREKEKQLKEAKNKQKVRDSWMTELPEDRKDILSMGLSARQFRTKEAIDRGDTSIWTDTPADVEFKKKSKVAKVKSVVNDQELIEDRSIQSRDKEMLKIVEKCTDKKRRTPLIDMHKSKKVKENSIKNNERRPFTREDDLAVNKFDEAQKATILKKAQQLNDRFSGGKAKFL